MNSEWDWSTARREGHGPRETLPRPLASRRDAARAMGLPLVGIRQAHMVLSSGGSVNEAMKPFEATKRSLKQAALACIGSGESPAITASRSRPPPPAISPAGRRLDDRVPADEQHRAPHGKNWSAGHEPG